MIKEKKIIYSGAFRFPNIDAAAQRVLNNAKIFRELGYSVEFVSWGGFPREEDKREDGCYYYQGFKYRNTYEIDHKAKISLIKRAASYIFRGKYSLSLISQCIKEIEIVIAYNPPAYFTYKLLSLCKKNKVLYISDITEWYSAEEFPGGKYAPPYWISEFNMHVLQKFVTNKILISSFLKSHFKESNNILLPPLVDELDEKWNLHKSVLHDYKGLRIIYAGTPGMKDKLEVVLEAVLACLKEGLKLEFVIIGVSKADIVNFRFFKEVISFPDNILLLGRLAQEDIPSYYQMSDFSIFVRENNRKTKSGFPTKLPESLMAGCPVIVNNTSDISVYVKNELNGIIISDFTVAGIKNILEEIATDERGIHKLMSEKAKLSALEKFCYKNYNKHVSSFLNKSK